MILKVTTKHFEQQLCWYLIFAGSDVKLDLLVLKSIFDDVRSLLVSMGMFCRLAALK